MYSINTFNISVKARVNQVSLALQVRQRPNKFLMKQLSPDALDPVWLLLLNYGMLV